MNASSVLAALMTGLAVAAVVGLVAPPTRRLAGRVRPYTVTAGASFGLGADPRAAGRALGTSGHGLVRALLGPLADRLGRLVDSSGDERLLLRLRQAGLLTDVPEPERVQELRIRQLGGGVAGAVVGAVVPAALGMSAGTVLIATTAGAVAGATRWRARIDRAIDDRRARMRIELYTIDQLLAMHVRVGGGVVQAVQRVCERGRGAVVAELEDALAAHAAGTRAPDAFTRIAESTPEPHAARTYKLLAAGAEYGADLADGLLALAESVRDVRRETLKRQATKRRAAMLVPIIAILAPVMLLFIAAPLPSLIFST